MALYPSLDAEMAALAVKRAVLESDIVWEGVDYKECVRYIALELRCEAKRRMSGLNRVLPVRRFNKGTRPGMTEQDPMGPNSGGEEQWVFPKVSLTDQEKSMIVATVAEIGVRVMFRTHVYQFGGKLYHQLTGGPIGLRSTCAVARVVMGDWDLGLISQLEEMWR